VPIPKQYLKPIANAALEAAFQAWQSLGNSSPTDFSGAAPAIADCIKLGALSFSKKTKFSLPLEKFDGESQILGEILGYRELWLALSGENPTVPKPVVEKLLPPCLSGVRRCQKILAALGFLFGDKPGEVPGMDLSAKHLTASMFFLEAGDLSAASRVLASGGWCLPQSYFVAGQIMLSASHTEPALTAFEMGAGMGDDACLSCCAALEFLNGNTYSPSFSALHRGAERGFAAPLLAAAAALSLGAGVDKDDELATTYVSLAKKCFLPPNIYEKLRLMAAARAPELLSKENRPRPCQGALSMTLNWASKHPGDPVHLLAAREWQRLNS
jgi:hypothetical protein